MIIVSLYGGLGNQMFQYAFAKNLATKLETKLYIDTSLLDDKSIRKDFTNRDYELECFHIKDPVIDKIRLSKFEFWANLFSKAKISTFNRRVLNNSLIIPKFFIEDSYSLQNLKNKTFSKNMLLKGYWQSELYFIESSNVIRDIYSFSFPETRLLIDIRLLNSISVHFRRGDYISNEHINSVHGVCPLSYYIKSINFLNGKVNNPIYYIFSDDIKWVKNALIDISSKNNVIFIENSQTPAQDLMLMSSCKHNIIANSSFSWWGAWLNKNPDKLVIAPLIWTKNKSENQHLIPKNWIRF
jgi:hypothetical protein